MCVSNTALHLIAPEPVLVEGSEAVDNNWKWKREYEAAHERTQSSEHLAKIGLNKILSEMALTYLLL